MASRASLHGAAEIAESGYGARQKLRGGDAVVPGQAGGKDGPNAFPSDHRQAVGQACDVAVESDGAWRFDHLHQARVELFSLVEADTGRTVRFRELDEVRYRFRVGMSPLGYHARSAAMAAPFPGAGC